MYGVVFPTHNTLYGQSLGPVPPDEGGFLMNSQGGYILLSNGGRIVISYLVDVENLREKLILKCDEILEKLRNG